MTILFFDTETSGLPVKGAANDDPRQPHIVQLAAVLTTDTGKIVSSVNVLVKCEGWTIEQKAQETHGISETDCLNYGISERAAVALFCNLAWQADLMVAHNIQFDLSLIYFALARAKPKTLEPFPDDQFCTMHHGRDLCQLPPTERMKAAGFNEFKAPKLAELYKFLFGEEMVGAHDAMADVQACMRCFFEMKERQNAKASA